MSVVVIGANGDLGRAIVERLRRAGEFVHAAGRERCDVTSLENVRWFLGVSWAERPFDRLVLAHAAPGVIRSALELSDQLFQHVLAVDLEGTFRVCREAKRYGPLSIVLLSSIHAIQTYPRRTAYAVAKAGVVGLTRSLAVEWGPDGTRVNCVLPGQVADTERTEPHPLSELLDRTPSGRLATPADVADTVAFLLEAKGINGQAIVVDGGYTASAWYGPHAFT